MAGVRKICDAPLQYIVTFTHAIHLDDCEMSVVELFAAYPDKPYFVCKRHADMSCKCVTAVRQMREDIKLDDKD